MLTNGKAKEGSKVLSPQVFNEETYCGVSRNITLLQV